MNINKNTKHETETKLNINKNTKNNKQVCNIRINKSFLNKYKWNFRKY